MDKIRVSQSMKPDSLNDEGNGLITVKGGITLSDESVQQNGTKYDIKSLSLDDYDGTLFADHGDSWGNYTIEKVIGKFVGLRKQGKKLVADGVQYAINASPLANFAYNMTREGFLNSFSIGTQGEPIDDNGTYRNHSVYEISQVGIPNNLSAKINTIAINSVRQAKEQGLDTSELEKALHLNDCSADKTSCGSGTCEVDKEDEVESLEEKSPNNIKENNMSDVKEDVKEVVETPVVEKTEAVENKVDIAEVIKNSVESATASLTAKIEELEKNAFDSKAEAPEFKQVKNAKNVLSDDWRENAQRQVNAFIEGGAHSPELRALNEGNLGRLKEEGLVKNAISLDSFGNFVACPEQLTEIAGCRNDYRALVDRFRWTETTSLQTSWLLRSGDISAQPIALCDVDKPVSEYGAEVRTADMELFAAITPVCNSLTRFSVADVLGDIADGYRTDYDRKRAEIAVGRFEQAVDESGNSVTYPVAGTDEEKLAALLQAIAQVCSCAPNGILVMSCKTHAEIMRLLLATGNGALAQQVVENGGVARLFGKEFILTPDDVLPDITVADDTRSVVVEGQTVTIQHAIFYVDPSVFSGRTSGGLLYNLFDQGTYHVGADVRSAVERNEVLIRGEYYRAGFVTNPAKVSGLINGTNAS